jgi:hypothetical protein
LFKFRSKIEIEKKQQKMKKKYLGRGPLGAARYAWVCGSSAPRRFKRGTGAPPVSVIAATVRVSSDPAITGTVSAGVITAAIDAGENAGASAAGEDAKASKALSTN